MATCTRCKGSGILIDTRNGTARECPKCNGSGEV